LIGLTSLLLIAIAAAVPLEPAFAQEQTPTTAAPTDAPPVRKLGKMDVRHPLHIGDNYYPIESRKHHEQGRCGIAFYINADGSVSAGQLLKSSGYPRLDIACIESVIDVPMLPATVNGTPVAGWSEFGVVWVVDRAPPSQSPLERSAVPRFADDYELQAGDKYYPEAARVKHERGYCVVQTTVGSTGTALNAAITRSTEIAIYW
jgi:TonB family protein